MTVQPTASSSTPPEEPRAHQDRVARATPGEMLARAFERYLSTRLDFPAGLFAADKHPRVLAEASLPTLPSETLDDTIATDLGIAPSDVFTEFRYAPDAVSLTCQWHTATLASGESVDVKIARPDIARQLGRRRRALGAVVRRRLSAGRAASRRLVDDFSREVERSLDLRGQAADLTSLARHADNIAFLEVPRVVEYASGRRCLTTVALSGIAPAPSPAEPESHRSSSWPDRYRRQVRIWLALALSGLPYPDDPWSPNVLLCPGGGIGIRGGPFRTMGTGARKAVTAYLSATSVGDHRRATAMLLELFEGLTDSAKRDLGYRLRHSDPFRDGGWSGEADPLVRAALTDWLHALHLGGRPRPDAARFMRALFTLEAGVDSAMPGFHLVSEAYQEVRLRRLLTDVASLAKQDRWAGLLENQARLLSGLPQTLDRLLEIGVARRDESEERSEPGPEDVPRWHTLAVLLGAMTVVATVTPFLAPAGTTAEAVGSLIFGALGLWALRTAIGESTP